MQTRTTIRSDYNWCGKNILLIDSDKINHRLHRIYFEQTNSILHCIANFEEASHLFHTLTIDIVLLEMHMLNKQWKDLLKMVSSNFNIPIIIQTTQHNDLEQIKNLEFPFKTIFSKPLNWTLYLESIDNNLKLDNSMIISKQLELNN